MVVENGSLYDRIEHNCISNISAMQKHLYIPNYHLQPPTTNRVQEFLELNKIVPLIAIIG